MQQVHIQIITKYKKGIQKKSLIIDFCKSVSQLFNILVLNLNGRACLFA